MKEIRDLSGRKPMHHVLMVVDHQATQQALTTILTDAGHEMLTTTQGDEALAMAQFQLFDLVIADASMPDFSSWELLEELRKVQPRVRAITVSDHVWVEGPLQTANQQHITRSIDEAVLKKAILHLFPG